VALHSCFHVLLGVSNVVFVCLETDCLIHHNRGAAVAGVPTRLFVPAVARELLEVFGDDIAVELGVEVTLESSRMLEKQWYDIDTYNHARDGNLDLTSRIILWIGVLQ
jgi:hypothetical protein